MDRRAFLVGMAAAAAGIAALRLTAIAQVPSAGQAPPSGRQGGATGRGRGGPAPVAPEKLARVSIMTYNFSSMIKLPWSTTTNENQTIALMDIPQ